MHTPVVINHTKASDTTQPPTSKSFKHNVWQLIFVPAIAIALLLSVSLVSFCLYELSKFVDLRGSAMTRKTAQLIYTPLVQKNDELIRALIEGSLEDPYVRAIHVHLDENNISFHSGPEFFPTTHNSLNNTTVSKSIAPTRRESQRSIIFSHPINSKSGDNTKSIGWVEMELLSSPYMVIHYQTILITIFITLSCLLVAAYLATRLFKNITDPLTHIKNVINHLAQGKLQTRVSQQESREFVYLADAINNMAESLELAQQDLQNHIEQSTHDLLETLETIEIKNIELDIARKEAIEASRIKSEFLANTSHEIRTPLNGILGFIGLALKTETTEQQTEYLQTIRNSAQGLLTVINGILDFSKIEAGKLTLEYAPLPLRQTIDETLLTLAQEANEKNLQIISTVAPEIPSNLLGDSLRFKQVLSNLISNAIKFSDHGDIRINVVTIAQQETHLMLKISITDQGIGLTPDQQSDLFKPFSQTDSSASREQGGTGLGLAICKGLVERMNGEIGVTSKVNEGSTFWFTARLGIDKKHNDNHPLPKLDNYRALICGSNNASLLQLQNLASEWRLDQETINEIHDIFPAIRKEQKSNRFDILILDIAPNERKITSALLENIAKQLMDEFNCKVIVCCTSAQQRSLRVGSSTTNIVFISKPLGYENLLRTLCDKLNAPNKCPNENVSPEVDSGHAASVLLVDDNPANLQLASELLRGLNTQVVQASNGLQAIEACKQNTFDVIFMDIQMPGMDGFETTRHIRELEADTRRTPIIALTAHSLTEQKSELLIAGMDDCVSKPVSEAQLAHIINRWACLSGKREVVVNQETATAKEKTLSIEKYADEKYADIDGAVDIELCLKLANKKPALARDMLKMMVESLYKEKQSINTAVANNDINMLGELIHRLYGSSCYCGVPRLKSITGLLDKLIQAKEVAQVEKAIPTLNKAIDDILQWSENRDIDEAFGLAI